MYCNETQSHVYDQLFRGYRFEVHITLEDECRSAEVNIERPDGDYWYGGEHGIETNSFFDDHNHHDLELPRSVHERLVDFVEECREMFD